MTIIESSEANGTPFMLTRCHSYESRSPELSQGMDGFPLSRE